jgi:fucose 4-O-acetylase-like acetyltransferase
MGTRLPRADAPIARTPPTRDRFVDLLRVVSIGMVVLGHWLIAGVVRQDGQLLGDNVLAHVSRLAPLTWLFQVMPIFFMVGGFTNAEALGRPGASTSEFLRRRLARLVPPTVLLVVLWIVLSTSLEALEVEPEAVRQAAALAGEPLWFLAVYLGLIILAPLQLAAHRRNRWVALAILPVVTLALDVLHLTGTAPGLADGNFIVVFLFAQELGFWYADGAAGAVSVRGALATATVALVALLALTTWGPYPLSMVGVPGEATSNMSPPTLCIVLLTVAQAALLLTVRPRVTRWLERPGPWRRTVAANSVVMSVFLWHLTAFIAASVALIGLGVALPPLGSTHWWLLKPVWLVTALVALAVILPAVSPVERRQPHPRATAGPLWLMFAAALACGAGIAAIAAAGFNDLFTIGGRSVFGVPVSPGIGATLLLMGWATATLTGRSGRDGSAGGEPHEQVE